MRYSFAPGAGGRVGPVWGRGSGRRRLFAWRSAATPRLFGVAGWVDGGGPDEAGEGFGAVGGDLGKHRCVGVGGEHDAGVPEQVLDDLEVGPGGKGEGGAAPPRSSAVPGGVGDRARGGAVQPGRRGAAAAASRPGTGPGRGRGRHRAGEGCEHHLGQRAPACLPILLRTWERIAVVARKETVHLIDDLDGTEATTSLTFAVDGVEYALDLSEKNAAKFHKAVGRYVDAANPVRPRAAKRTGTKGGAAVAPGQDLAAIRAWARDNGFEVASHGRIPRAVAEAYQAAH